MQNAPKGCHEDTICHEDRLFFPFYYFFYFSYTIFGLPLKTSFIVPKTLYLLKLYAHTHVCVHVDLYTPDTT